MKTLSTAMALWLTVGVASTHAEPRTVIDDSKVRQYLVTMSATSGSFDNATLTLNDVPLVVYFTDRPYRQAGHMSRQDFVNFWRSQSEVYKNDPPNAALSIHERDRDAHAVLIVSEPKLTENGLSFDVKILDETIPDIFDHATLFIDPLGFAAQCGPQGALFVCGGG